MPSSQTRYTYVRGEIVPQDKAVLHVSDLSVQRGYGVFDFFKIHNGHPFFLNDYLDRFEHSARTMRLPVPVTRDELKSIIYALIEKNNMPNSGIKILLTGGYSPDGYQLATPNLILTQHELSLPSRAQIEKGVKITVHEFVRDIPAVKTINYSMGIWLADKINQAQAADVLYHRGGVASEFPRCNFFIVRHDNTVCTPLRDVLHGITRKNILALTGHPYTTAETTVTLDDVYNAKEAFLTSTTKRIVPIVQVDDKVIGDGKPGEVTLALLDALIALESEDRNAAKVPVQKKH